MLSCRRWGWASWLGVCSFILWLGPNASVLAGDTPASAPAKAPPKYNVFSQAVQARISDTLDNLEKDGDYNKAFKEVDGLFREVVAYVPTSEAKVFREAAYARRLVYQLSRADKKYRTDLLKFLRKNDEFARTLMFLMRIGPKSASGRETLSYGQTPPTSANIMALVDRLIRERGDKLKAYPNLAAAICVVHGAPLVRHINENKTTAPDPLDIFDYYTTNEKFMLFGIKPVPAELLIWVVDATASIDDLKWALEKYKGDQAVGRHFFDVKYDYDAYRTGLGTQKKVAQEGYTLPNLLKYGGICADQAYFAMSVGKAIGVPTAYVCGESGSMGHAWVGFFQNRTPAAGWNFEEGRYQAYKGVRGFAMDPQSRLEIPDSYVALQAEMLGTKAQDRQIAAAFTDAAILLYFTDKDGDKWDSQPSDRLPDSGRLPTARTPNVEAELALLEAGLRRFCGYSQGWYLVQHLAEDKKLTLAHKRRWADIVLKLCAVKYPDFAMDLVAPMIRTVENPNEQNGMWEMLFKQFNDLKRADLSAEVRTAQATMWEKAGNNANAIKACQDVINRFANAGPFVISTLSACERLMKTEGKEKQLSPLYETTWARLDKPDHRAAPEFRKQSNWYKVGVRFMQILKDAGENEKAEKVKEMIEKEIGTKIGKVENN